MNVRSLANVLRLIRSIGIRKTVRSLKHRFEDRFLEYRLDISTSMIRTKQELGLTRDVERHYAPTGYAIFKKLMTLVEIQVEGDVFVDFGTGMGRVAIMAALYPFRRVIGVDISDELCRIAEANVRRCQHKLLCQDVSIVACDATTFSIPTDMTVAFFFNPFTGMILDRVLENIRQSVIAFPRRIQVVCNDFSEQSAFACQMRNCPWLTRQKCIPLGDEGDVGSIYVNS
jgi:SAM-dependent methyltransferase